MFTFAIFHFVTNPVYDEMALTEMALTEQYSGVQIFDTEMALTEQYSGVQIFAYRIRHQTGSICMCISYC